MRRARLFCMVHTWARSALVRALLLWHRCVCIRRCAASSQQEHAITSHGGYEGEYAGAMLAAHTEVCAAGHACVCMCVWCRGQLGKVDRHLCALWGQHAQGHVGQVMALRAQQISLGGSAVDLALAAIKRWQHMLEASPLSPHEPRPSPLPALISPAPSLP